MTVADNIAMVRERMERAATKSARSVDSVTLIAVSKQKSIAAIEAAYDAGVRHFGENRAYELQEKAEALSYPDLSWHFIGHLQKRQARPVADRAAVFHAVDRFKIAKRLNGLMMGSGRTLPALIEVNISGEETKGGYNCSQWETDGEQRDKLCHDINALLELPNIKLQGVMTMAPWGAPEPQIRAIFQRTRALREMLQESFPDITWSQLSMGMTDDYEIAIEEGATQIRVGRAIFGARFYG